MRDMLLSIIITLSVTSTMFAQNMHRQNGDSLQTPEEPRYKLKPIIITATRTERPVWQVPYTIDVIKENEIQRAEVGLSLDEVLRYMPGVVVNNRYNLSQGDRISIRGIGSRAPFGVRGIKIIVDGTPLTMADGQAQLNNLDLGSAGKIEVLRGPSSSLYGNAAGGLINIETELVPNIPFKFQPRFIVGSNRLRKWQGKVLGQIGRHRYLINVNKLALDGYRDHSSAKSTSINAVGRHDISNFIKLKTVFNYYDAPFLLNPSSLSKMDALTMPTKARFFVMQQGAGKQIRQGQGSLTVKYINESKQFITTIYGVSRSLLNAIPGRIIELDRNSWGMRTVFSGRFHAANAQFRWTIGSDIEAQYDRREEFQNLGLPGEQVEVVDKSSMFNLLEYGARLLDQDEKVLGIGPFTELELLFGSKLRLTLGQRYDHYNFKVTDRFMEDGSNDSGTRNLDKFSPMVGLIYRPHDFIKLYVNYSTAFQTPTTTELSNRPTGQGGFNPTLMPEKINSYDFGLKGLWPARQFGYDLAFYILTIEDMLIPFQMPGPGSEEIFFRNAGKTRNKGAEIKIDWIPAKGLRTAIAYTFMDFVFKDFVAETSSREVVKLVQLAGNNVPGVPHHRFFAGINYEHTTGAYAEVNLQWVDKYFTNDFNGPPPDSDKSITNFVNNAYLNVDMRLGFQTQIDKIAIEFFSGINNLFDKRYNSSIVPNAFGDRFFEPSAGRSWYNGINITFPGGS